MMRGCRVLARLAGVSIVFRLLGGLAPGSAAGQVVDRPGHVGVMVSFGSKSVLVAVLVVLLGASPVAGQTGPEQPSGGSESGTPTEDDAPEPVDCDAIETEEGWSESEFAEVVNCLFDEPRLSGAAAPPSKGSDGSVRGSSDTCGEIDVTHVAQQYLPRRFFGFVREHLRVYLAEFHCEDGTPAEGYATRLQIIRGPGSGGFSSWCWVRRGDGVESVRTNSANGCPSYTISTYEGAAIAAHLHRVNGSQDTSLRQVVMWADLDRDGRHDAGEPYDLTFSPDDGVSNSFSVRRLTGQDVARSGARTQQSVEFSDEFGR